MKKFLILLFFFFIVNEIFSANICEGVSGICSNPTSGTASCNSLSGDECPQAPGCAYYVNSNGCKVKPGSPPGIYGTYDQLCARIDPNNNQYSLCSIAGDYSSCVNTVCATDGSGQPIYGCYWEGQACTGTPNCQYITNSTVCCNANCEFTPTQTCNLNKDAPCNPGDLPPNCCKFPNFCFLVDPNGGRYQCIDCLSQGLECGSSSDCCTGLVCRYSGEGEATKKCLQCADIGELCEDSNDCCSKICNISSTGLGSCVSCLNENEGLCSKDSDCCSGLSCNMATRKCIAPPPPPCKKPGEYCSVNSDCCSPPKYPQKLYCDNLNKNPPVCRTCLLGGESCNSDLLCCEGFECNSGKCELKKGDMICGSDEFKDVVNLSGISALLTILLIVLVYMIGEFFQNAKMITWAKIETSQVFVSIIVVSVVLYLISVFCTMNIAEASTISSSMPFIYKGFEHLDVYQGAQVYLEHLIGITTRNMASIRFNQGAYEIRTSYTKFNCKDIRCLFTFAGFNEARYSGESILISLTNSMLNIATIYYFSAIFQYFTLQYIFKGLFLGLLPFALVLRSIPFMRNFGGALIGIIVALYVLYPFMLILDAIVAPYFASISSAVLYDRDRTNCAGIDMFKDSLGNSYVRCIQTSNSNGINFEWELGKTATFISERDLPTPGDINDLIKINVLLFLVSIFLPALNFVIIGAFAREITRFLGEEADISRLGQMI